MTDIIVADRTSILRTFIEHGFEFISVVGKGGFASVFLVKSIKYCSNFVIKRVPFRDSPSLKEAETDCEIESLKNLSHPFIIKMYEFFKDENALYIVLEHCENGSMADLIDNAPLKPIQFWDYAKQILEALKACHNADIAHRDIKPGNILIDQYRRTRLADFGLAHHLTEGAYLEHHSGSLAFMSPEIVQRFKFDPKAADVWALGITFYCMVVGTLPFNLSSREELVASIIMGEIKFPQWVDLKIKRFIQKMTRMAPRSRPTVEALLESPEFSPVPGVVKKRISIRSNGPGQRRLVSSSLQMLVKIKSDDQDIDVGRNNGKSDDECDENNTLNPRMCNSFRLSTPKGAMGSLCILPKLISCSPVCCNNTFSDEIC